MIIINADDFGISKVVNKAILNGFRSNVITRTSVMVNLLDTIEEIPSKTGIHFNLTTGKALTGPSCITDNSGNFKYGFLWLFIMSMISKKILRTIENELQAQIAKYFALGLNLNHIDSHRHVHMIPPIFKIIKGIAVKLKVSNIRVMNESFWHTLVHYPSYSYFVNTNIIKYLVLKTFYYINGVKSDTYFFSILYSGHINQRLLDNIKIHPKYKDIEIMIHPKDNQMNFQNYQD